MSAAVDYQKYRSAYGVRSWAKRCRFATRDQAAKALEVPIRTLYRYLEKGLPEGAPGNFVAHRMHMVEMQRRRTD